MQIFLNGESRSISATTLAELVAELDLAGRRIAIEHNGDIAPRSEYAIIHLATGDRVEIVHAIGGG